MRDMPNTGVSITTPNTTCKLAILQAKACNNAKAERHANVQVYTNTCACRNKLAGPDKPQNPPQS